MPFFKGVGDASKTKFRLRFIAIYLINLSLKYSKITSGFEMVTEIYNDDEGAGKSNPNSASKNVN